MGRSLLKDYFDDWQDAVVFLNDLGWNLSWKYLEDQWHLWSGDQKLFLSNSDNEIQAFICGMAIGLAVLPDFLLDKIKQIAEE